MTNILINYNFITFKVSIMKVCSHAVVVSVSVVVVAFISVFYFRPEYIIKALNMVIRIKNGLRLRQMYMPGNHINIEYFERDCKGKCEHYVLFVHGIAVSKEDFADAVKHLPTNYKIVAMDLPGHGGSATVEGQYGTDYFVFMMKSFTDNIGLHKPFHIVGHSLGGYLVSAYAAQFPGDVLSITSISPGGVKNKGADQLVKEFDESDGKKCKLIPETEAEVVKLLEFLFHTKQELHPWIITGILQLRESKNDFLRQVLREAFQVYTKYEKGLTYFLKQVKVPVLVVWGKQDQVLHVESINEIKEEVTAPLTVELIDDCGHVPSLETPEKLMTAIQKFIDTV